MASGKHEAQGRTPAWERRLKEIAGCARRGESVKAYAERTGQSVYPLYEAKRQARRAGVLPPHRAGRSSARAGRGRPTRPRFVEAVVPRPAPDATSKGPLSWRLRLPNGAVLESTTPLDPTSLERLVAGLRGAR